MFAFLQPSDLRDLDLDLELGHTAYCRVALIDLFLHAKLYSNWKNYLSVLSTN